MAMRSQNAGFWPSVVEPRIRRRIRRVLGRDDDVEDEQQRLQRDGGDEQQRQLLKRLSRQSWRHEVPVTERHREHDEADGECAGQEAQNTPAKPQVGSAM